MGKAVTAATAVQGGLRPQSGSPFRDHDEVNSIAQSFPVLSLEEVYGAIAFYLGHQIEIKAYLQKGEKEFEALRHQSRQSNPLLYQKLEESRQQPPAART